MITSTNIYSFVNCHRKFTLVVIVSIHLKKTLKFNMTNNLINMCHYDHITTVAIFIRHGVVIPVKYFGPKKLTKI